MFESLKASLERLLRAHSGNDPRARVALLREAILEAKVGVSTMRDALVATELELDAERRQLADTERRGRLAAEVPDPETAAVAERFSARHRERVVLLERKLVVQRDELALAEREVAEMMVQLRTARAGSPFDSVDAAWREVQGAGGERPGSELEEESARAVADRKLKEAVEAQLAYLKKKLGKQ